MEGGWPRVRRACWTRPAEVRDALGGDFHFPQIPDAGQLFGYIEVFANRVADIGQSLLFGGSLRPAAGEAGARDAVALLRSH